MGNQNPQVFIDNCRQQIDWLDQRIGAYDQELANLGPSVGNQAANVYHNLLVQERNAIVGEQRRLSTLINNLAEQRGQFREVKQQFNAEVARLRESYMQAVSDLRKAVDEVMAEVRRAQREGRDFKGPEGSFRIVEGSRRSSAHRRTSHPRSNGLGNLRVPSIKRPSSCTARTASTMSM